MTAVTATGSCTDVFAAAPGDADSIPVVDPATGRTVAAYRIANEADVDAAVRRAEAAFETWGRLPVGERAELLLRVADEIEAAAEAFALAESSDVGKPVSTAREEIPGVVDVFRFNAGAARTSAVPALGEYTDGRTSGVRRQPLGVVGLITPWNYPLLMAAWKIAPALAAGDTVVIKPSELTPETTIMLVDLIARILPAGVCTLVLGDATTGRALVAHPTVRLISLTGDVGTGKAVAASAATTLKRVALELGGKAPALVFADAPIDRVAATLAPLGFANSGQDCTAACRIIVEDAAYDQFVTAYCAAVDTLVLGDPADPATHLGPLVSERHLERVAGFVDRARDAGATIRTGGRRRSGTGWYYEPTVITDIAQDDEIIQQEVFGPVVTIQRGPSDDDMLAMANDVDYGLSASVWTTDLARTMRFTRDLEFGTVWVNDALTVASEMPFGGMRGSGYGRELSPHGIDEFSELKHVMINPEIGTR